MCGARVTEQYALQTLTWGTRAGILAGDVPPVADVCKSCQDKPIADLLAYWRSPGGQEQQEAAWRTAAGAADPY
jgi:hypothetical protein